MKKAISLLVVGLMLGVLMDRTVGLQVFENPPSEKQLAQFQAGKLAATSTALALTPQPTQTPRPTPTPQPLATVTPTPMPKDCDLQSMRCLEFETISWGLAKQFDCLYESNEGAWKSDISRNGPFIYETFNGTCISKLSFVLDASGNKLKAFASAPRRLQEDQYLLLHTKTLTEQRRRNGLPPFQQGIPLLLKGTPGVKENVNLDLLIDLAVD